MATTEKRAIYSGADVLQSIYFPQLFHVNETLKLSNLKGSDPNEINEYLLNRIRTKIGNKCIDIGYIDKDSITIVSRTLGQVNTSHFNGEVYYHIRCQANICKPVEGTRLSVKIVDKNKIGLLAIQGPLYIYLPAVYLENAEILDTVSVGSMALIEIVNYTYQLNDTFIKVGGKFIKSI